MLYLSRLTGSIRSTRRAVARPAPSPPEGGVLGNLDELKDDQLGFYLRLFNAYGDVARFRIAWAKPFLVAHPDGVRHVMQENAKNYDKQTRGWDKLRLFLGNGLIVSEGDFWLRQRRLMQPAFHRDRLAGFAATMVRAASAECDALELLAREGKPIDVAHRMSSLTLRVVAETLFGTDVTRDSDAIYEALNVVLDDAMKRILAPIDLSDLIGRKRFAGRFPPVKLMDELVYRLISERRKSGARPNDLMQMLMDARDEDTGDAMNDEQLRDEVLTLILAGHETTAMALAWTFYLLSTHPEARLRLEAELDAVLGGREPVLDDLARLPYTKNVVQEAMRLYPPAWNIGRGAIDDDEIGGYSIPKGSIVFVLPWVTHRHPEIWTNPEGFDPDRFLPERFASIPKFGYFPFGGGGRICIGQGFAMLEAPLLLATMAQRFRFDLVPGARIVPEPLITLRPKYGVHVAIKKRDRAAR